ncbi:MAG TPA: DUF1294 domain-containing protein [Candidatus Thermoplasmatota archaeon]|nr:DUF1294 domain-containing protein [Candidatus Thermoplasmatota archaeon]
MEVVAALLLWVAVASVVTFAIAASDKARARRGAGRVPERVLLGLALVGGSPGLILAMLITRHKTRKLGFLAPLALVLAVQGAAVWWLFLR